MPLRSHTIDETCMTEGRTPDRNVHTFLSHPPNNKLKSPKKPTGFPFVTLVSPARKDSSDAVPAQANKTTLDRCFETIPTPRTKLCQPAEGVLKLERVTGSQSSFQNAGRTLSHEPTGQLFGKHARSTITIVDAIDRFLADEFEPDDSLWDLVVLTGSQNVWASTVGQYVNKRWPRSEQAVKDLFMLIKAIATMEPAEHALTYADQANSQVTINIDRHLELVTPRTWMKFRLSVRRTMTTIVLHGAHYYVDELEQALSWLNAVLQPASEISGPAAASVSLQRRPVNPLNGNEYELKGHIIGPLSVPASHACWIGLFPHTSCAVDFWTPQRSQLMYGVEISFELMCLLSGIEYEVNEQDGIVLYGRKAAVYPVLMHGECVQWHLEDIEPGRPTMPRKRGDGMLFHDLKLLQNAKRHFLGVWHNADVLLGTSDLDKAKLRWSNLREVHTECSRSESSFGASVALPKVLTLSFNQTYKIARSRRNQYMASFEANLHRMIQAPVMLYSPSQQRGWLVSYTSVLLYLARTRASYQHSLGYSIPSCEKADDGGQAAFDCIKGCKDHPLTPDGRHDSHHVKIEHYIKEVMAAMEVTQRESCRAKQAMRPIREKMLGFELADVAFMKPTMRLKQHALDWFATGWAPLLDEVQFTFFYEGLPDLIVPSESVDQLLSHNNNNLMAWRNIPEGFNLLTASLPCLTHLAERYNKDHTLDSLTTKYDWNCPGVVFSSPTEPRSYLQELVPKGKARSPQLELSTAAERGAVCFRYALDMKNINATLQRRQRIITAERWCQIRQRQSPRVLDSRLVQITCVEDDAKVLDATFTAHPPTTTSSTQTFRQPPTTKPLSSVTIALGLS